MSPEVEIIEHTPYEGFHDVVISRRSQIGRVKIENVEPSEFLISRESKTIEEARFVCHRVIKTLSELREMWPDVDFDPAEMGSGEDMVPMSGERLARYSYDNSAGIPWGGLGISYPEEVLREYWLHESYLRTDHDGDGIAELRKVCTVGSMVISNEPIDRIPFVSVTPIKIPHKFFGLSIADVQPELWQVRSIRRSG